MSTLPAYAGGEPIRTEAKPVVFGAPCVSDQDVAAVSDCLRSGWLGAGPRVSQFEAEFAAYKGARFAAALNSGTAALHLALLALGVGEGDEVVVPTMTFGATVSAVLYTGAKPVLVDCQSDTLNVNPDLLEDVINEKTRVIVVVHVGGRCCEMDRILTIARKHNLKIVEDCAHAIESSYRGVGSGLIGDVGCFSFYPTKNITTGDGGMVITNNEEVFESVKRMSMHGMSASAWERMSSGNFEYSVTNPGYKYNMNDMAASLGLAQLSRIDVFRARREELWTLYDKLLSPEFMTLPSPPEENTRHAYHLYIVQLRESTLEIGRDETVRALYEENVGSGVHYVPVHKHPYFSSVLESRDEDYPVATQLGKTVLSLPISAALTSRDIKDVCIAVNRILEYGKKRKKISGKAG